MLVILEGESLLNDASALLIYRVAVGPVAGGLTPWTAPLAALGAVGGVVLGFALARAMLRRSRTSSARRDAIWARVDCSSRFVRRYECSGFQ